MRTDTDVAINSAYLTLVKGDPRAIARARELSIATVRNKYENLGFAMAYNALGIPLVAGVPHTFTWRLLSPMGLSSMSVIATALRLQRTLGAA